MCHILGGMTVFIYTIPSLDATGNFGSHCRNYEPSNLKEKDHSGTLWFLNFTEWSRYRRALGSNFLGFYFSRVWSPRHIFRICGSNHYKLPQLHLSKNSSPRCCSRAPKVISFKVAGTIFSDFLVVPVIPCKQIYRNSIWILGPQPIAIHKSSLSIWETNKINQIVLWFELEYRKCLPQVCETISFLKPWDPSVSLPPKYQGGQIFLILLLLISYQTLVTLFLRVPSSRWSLLSWWRLGKLLA